MAKAYTLYERQTGNGNPVAVAVPTTKAGGAGSLASTTTFYYKVIADGYDNYYHNTQAWISAPSAEVSATTDASNRVIWIHYDNDVSGQQDTIVIRSEVSGDYTQTNSSGVSQVHFPRVLGAKSSHYMGVKTNGVTTYDRYEMTSTAGIASLSIGETITEQVSGATALVVSDPAGGTTFKVWALTGTFDGTNPFDGSVTGVGAGTWSATSATDGWVMEDSSGTAGYVFPVYDEGLPCLVITGGTEIDPVTPQDIYEYLLGAGKSYCIDGISMFPDDDYKSTNGYNICDMFRWKFTIYMSGTTNWYYQPGGTVISQTLAKTSLLCQTTFGDLSADGVTTNGCALIGAHTLAMYSSLCTSGATTRIYGSSLGAYLKLTSECNNNPYYQASGYATIKDSIFKSTGRFNVDYTISNSRMMLSGEAGVRYNKTPSVTNATFNTSLGSYYAEAEATWVNVIFQDTYTFDVLMEGYYTPNATKCLHFHDTTYTDEAYILRYRGTTGSDIDFVFLDNKTLELNIIDPQGNPIEDATIFVEDVDGKYGLFNKEWSAQAGSTALLKTGTTLTTTSGSLTIGKYYRSGNEIIKVVSGTNPYTITRGEQGSTANNISGGTTTKASYLYEQLESVETDSDGYVSMALNYKYWVGLNKSNSTVYLLRTALLDRAPYKIRIQKSGYITEKMEYTPDETRNMTVQLTPVKSYNQHKSITKS